MVTGSTEVAFVKGDGFESIPGTPTYITPGRNVQVNNVNLDRALARLRAPGTVEAVESLAGQLSGAVDITYGMSSDTHDDVRDIVFNDSGTGFTSGRPAFSRWFLGTDYLTSGSSSTVERVLKGCVPLSYSLNYNVNQNSVTESLSLVYSDEERNTSITPSTVTRPSDGSDVAFHGTTLDIDGVGVSKLQSATLSFQGPMARYQRGPQHTAVDAVAQPPNMSLTTDIIFAATDYIELAYGANAATSTTARMSDVAATLTFDVGGTTVAAYNLSKVKPEGYSWSDLMTPDADLTENIDFQVTGDLSITT